MLRMFIETETTPNPSTLKFLPGEQVMPTGTREFTSPEAAEVSPLAQALFDLGDVTGVFFGRDFVSVTAAPGVEWRGELIALGLGNGRQAGGGQALCPEALVDDGLLDLTIVPELSGEVAATLGTLVTEGRQAALERVAIQARVPWVEIDAQPALTLNLDGEPVAAMRFRIDCVAGRVRMHLPADSPLRQSHAPVRDMLPPR